MRKKILAIIASMALIGEAFSTPALYQPIKAKADTNIAQKYYDNWREQNPVRHGNYYVLSGLEFFSGSSPIMLDNGLIIQIYSYDDCIGIIGCDSTRQYDVLTIEDSYTLTETDGTSKTYRTSRIGEYAFANTKNIKKFEIKDTENAVSDIGRFVFSDSTIEEITIPFASFSPYALTNCPKLKTVNIGSKSIDSPTRVPISFAADCENLKTVNLTNIYYIDINAFNDCRELTTINQYNPKGEKESTVKTIGNSAFLNCFKLSDVDFSNAEEIDERAFYSCSKITNTAFDKDGNNKIKALGEQAFYDTQIKSIKINNQNIICNIEKQSAKKKKILPKNILNIKKYTYTGKIIKPSITIREGNYLLKRNKDYTIKYGTNKIGKGTVTITGKGNYTGKIVKTFTIKPRKATIVLGTAKKKLVVKISKRSEASKYQIQYSTNSKFKGAKTVNTKLTRKVLSAKSKKKYYVRARVIKTIGGKNYVGSWSAVRTIKVK